MKKISIVSCLLLVLSLSACGGPRNVNDKRLEVSFLNEVYHGTYAGTIEKGVPNGLGVFHSESGDKTLNYSGDWSEGKFSGVGEIEFNNFEIDYNNLTYSGIYSGEVLDGIPNGSGKFKSDKDTFIYEGNWESGQIKGDGQLETNNYIVHFTDGVNRQGNYKGEVVDGIANGSGVFTAVNDSNVNYTYTGEWKDGLYEGDGRLVWDRPDAIPQQGNFKKGDFYPTPFQFFATVGMFKDQEYQITEKAQKFLETYPDIFKNNTEQDEFITTEFKYYSFAKNQQNYGDKLIRLNNLIVVQIIEENYLGDDHTFCILEDQEGNVYSLNMYGFAANVYEGDVVTTVFLPLDYFTYPNTAGTDIWAVAGAGVSISK